MPNQENVSARQWRAPDADVTLGHFYQVQPTSTSTRQTSTSTHSLLLLQLLKIRKNPKKAKSAVNQCRRSDSAPPTLHSRGCIDHGLYIDADDVIAPDNHPASFLSAIASAETEGRAATTRDVFHAPALCPRFILVLYPIRTNSATALGLRLVKVSPLPAAADPARASHAMPSSGVAASSLCRLIPTPKTRSRTIPGHR
ncbi:hypothetical protein B0H13DRAFT_2657853 [Mycena leptocephala]|nr:hypothetical protein B0H13DRAFT_2657853 [Mycena leptocephala]